ncbi:sn-glycerol-3-phosphate ABC transporter ATP-binding protein UgpC [Vibrio sp. Isolate23]|uniref:ABC transporter ATP-binding protein n=1 Tax=Vibrio TaxID=662 RepID=UPI001EFC9416|nr:MULTISPECIES: sn-glycerol-3-phosphate ABC transporter ATP-binding protein UgpC [Vibrio]MCG9681689.1 sn-glycerol-3-phosphate ABC transporter ATP-binding protein UgpC [Vibrio sp. Isolate23]USD34764.1 sn-glycerol-3-phosphate ABC transporter ATP-binding protein UgpC [Vibrio sp. SCSIO 43186]USD47830.1 sn-glycerol-3-phosphate ABC transporter ATP-binding protein UgpC [Vibrio sp. SCSIO 43145]USD71889.1 sn-glycerol-3-phosphate ABC transporter ATP-binding protein UgpC [Vibrio sp. SCSIO 43139]USD97549
MAEVTLKGVEKIYPNGFKAVHGVDLNIREGEFMVFVGPSGCAKSTTLRMIAGLEEISHGDVYIGDKRVNDLPPKDRGISMVFQNYALYPHMSVYENMAFGLKQQKLAKSEIDQRISEAAKTLEIEHLLQNKPGEMSGGQRQRVALGRAMVRKPDVFLFDEPLSNLDAKLRVSTRVSIAQLHSDLKAEGQNATMIYVTHDQVEAMTLGDRICVLNQGEIMQVDTPMNLYRYPANKFVAGFIGSPAMNIIKARIEEIDGVINVLAESGTRWTLPESKQDLARQKIGQWVWFGIRPEHIQLANHDAPLSDVNTQHHSINVVESMGNELYLYFQVGRDKLIARVPFDADRMVFNGEETLLNFNVSECHIFDIDTEQALV